MSKRARVALKVLDLGKSLDFYIQQLGFQLVEAQAIPDTAVIIDEDGDHLLLAGPSIQNVEMHLDEPRLIFKPGDKLTFRENDLDTRLATLTARGLAGIQQETNKEGDRKLIIEDPCGYKIIYEMYAQRSPEEILARYAQGGEELEKTLQGLSADYLDRSRSADEWTIRQIVHHLVESESIFLMAIKTALAQSGSTFIRSPYDQTQWVEALQYKERSIEPSLAFVKASRHHIAQLLEAIPDHRERYIIMKFASDSEGYKTTVGNLLNILVKHLAEHCEEIRETRDVHHL